MPFKTLFTIMLLFCTTTIWAASAIDTTLSFKRIGNVALSPDSKNTVYTISQINLHNKTREYSLFLQDQAGITTQIIKAKYVSLPMWSPDGHKLAYLITHDKKQEIKIFDLNSKTSATLISLNDRNINSFKWSPDAKTMAIVAEDEKKSKSLLPTPIKVASDFENLRIFLLPINEKSSPVSLTSKEVSISQYFIPNLDGGFDWSPDGKNVVYAYQPRAGADYSIKSKIAVINVVSGKITEIPYMSDHNGSQPTYSPDGKWIAFHSNLTQIDSKILFYTDPVNNGQICVVNTTDLKTHCLQNTFNDSAAIIGWAANSQSLYAFDWYKTVGPQIYELTLDPTVPVKTLSNTAGFIEPMTLAYNTRHFAFGFETSAQAPEIFKSDVQTFKLEQITHLQKNQPLSLGTEEVIRWKSRDNMEIEGILIKPANYDPKKKYPLLVSVHGGPAGAWAVRYLGGCDEFGDMILPACTQPVLDAGFLILQPNYRGSSGYGKTFRAANVGDFGGSDFQDVMTGVDHLIEKNIADPDHLAIYGWSYGGYMTNWAVTQTNRFKTAIAGAGLSDFVSFEGTTDIPYYLHYYLASALWDDNSLYLKRSPVSFSKNVKTPLLIMHGKEDIRVPVTQGYEFYNLLQLQNKPVQMIVYPDQGHILTDANIIYESQVDAIQWLKQAL